MPGDRLANALRRLLLCPLRGQKRRYMTIILTVVIVVVILALLLLATSVRQVQQYEQGVVLRFGRLLPELRGPGLRLVIPIADRMRKVSMQTIVMGVPA